LDHFSGALLLGGFADVWASFLVPDSSVQYLPDQATKFVGNYSNGLIVSHTRHVAPIENLEALSGKPTTLKSVIFAEPTSTSTSTR
jgi:hypothetical protein